MNITQINQDLDILKQPNFYDGMSLNVNDLEQLQIYLNKKIEDSTRHIGFDGLTNINGLQVSPDSIMAKPFDFPTVPQSSSNPTIQNFRDFPENPLDTQDVRMYQVFEAKTDNIQRFDLKLQLVEGAGISTLVVELRELSVPSNPLSAMKNDALYVKQYPAEEIPSLASDGRLAVDLSGQNSGQGIALTQGSYYAIYIRLIRESESRDQLRIYHSNQAETAIINSDLGAHFFVNGNFQKGLYNENAELINLVLWHEVYTSAIQVESGTAYKDGERIVVDTAQRFISLSDKRNSTDTNEYPNYIAIKFVLDSTDAETHPRTRDQVNANYEDTFEVKAFNQNEWNVELAKDSQDREYFLLAVVLDRNIIPFEQLVEFDLDQRTNLAYKDWLNPCVSTPSLAALNIQASRPDDFVFFIDNVPAEFPVVDVDGNQEYDTLGQPLVDTVQRMFLLLYLDGGQNTRKIEMALHNSTSTSPSFNNYFVTITDPDGDLIPGLANFEFDSDEITPNTFYNFVALTTRGRSIFIQDYNKQIRTPDPNTGLLSLTRERQFETRLNAGVISIVINEDLKLGDAVIPFGNVGQRVVGFESVRQIGEVPGRNGTTAEQTVTAMTDTLLGASDYKFEPLPMSFADGTEIDIDPADYNPSSNHPTIVQATEDDAIVVKVDGVPISYSGTEGEERGGTGAPHTVSGQIKFSDDPVERLQQMQALSTSLGITAPTDANDFDNYTGLKVTVRDENGRDNSQQGLTAVTQMDGSVLVYRVVAMGRGAGNPAGFFTGETGNVYFENRLARDIVGVPLEFTYTPFGSSIMDVRQIDSQEQWFGERTLVYAPDLTTFRARTTASSEVGIDTNGGQIFWNEHDETLLFSQLGLTATIEYYHLDQKFETINFYYTRLAPWGTKNKCPIPNTDTAIQQAIADQDIIIKVNGSSSLDGDPNFLTTASNFVAMHPGSPNIDQSLLEPNKISINPETGRIVFGVDIAPSTSDDVTITYYYLKPLTTCTANALGISYDSRFDFNLDGRVDQTDLNQFLSAYGSSTGDPNYNTIYDFNNDGVVNDTDWDEFLVHFGTVESGESPYADATEARLDSILIFDKNNPLRRLEAVRAVSMASSSSYPLGRSVIFLSADTPVLETGDFIVMFGFAAALATGINSTTVTTTQSITQVTKDMIEMYNTADITEERTIIDVLTTTREVNDITLYDNVLTFTPSVTESGTHMVRAIWNQSGLAITNREMLLSTVDREERVRRVFGPFRMSFTNSDFHSDGTSITIRLASDEASMADGTSDSSGLHLDGEPLHKMRFSILLFVPVDNNKVDVWRWHSLSPSESDQGLVLTFNDYLALDSRFRGKNNIPVLQPFGTAQNQVDLRPKYAGGDIENNLANLVVIRDDFISKYAKIHNHTSDTEGGILTSENVTFEDPEARFESGSVTDVVYQLQDELQETVNSVLSQIADLQLNATKVIFTDTRGCFGSPSGSLTVADALNKLLDFIAWDELNNCS